MRKLEDWIPSYLRYTNGTEAPKRMHFWTAVATIAGVLRRRVWVDMKRFVWYPNFYIVFVAPPGVVSKTITMGMGVSLLREVPGICIGPDVVTWQSLPGLLTEASESFLLGEDWVPQSAMTLASNEFGNLIDPTDKFMVNFYIEMWDGGKTFDKVTKTSGIDSVEAPWINMIGCTTPDWISENFTSSTIGGGFASRCVFVYGGAKKERLIAWPDEAVEADHEPLREALIADLEYISLNLCGPIKITEEARTWGRKWYEELWTNKSLGVEARLLEGYLVRKQTHMVKLAMVLSVSRGDTLTISLEDLVLANTMLGELEGNMEKIFSQVGKKEDARHADEFLRFVESKKRVPYAEAFRYIHSFFPDFREFEGMLAGFIRSGMVKMEFDGPDPQRDAVLVFIRGQNS